MGWNHVVAVTINHSKCGGSNSANFPFLFSGTYAALKTVGNGGQVHSSSGFDIAFYSDAGATTILPFDRDTWDGTTGACNFHVLIASLTHSTDVVIYIAYGDSSVITDLANPASLWSAAKCEYVMHGGDGTTINVNDSSANAANGVNHSCTAVAGVVGGGVHTTTGQSIDTGTPLGTVFDGASNHAVTFSAWVFPTNANNGNFPDQVEGNNSTSSPSIARLGFGDSVKMNLLVTDTLAETNSKFINSPSGITFSSYISAYHHLVFCLDVASLNTTDCHMYIDGAAAPNLAVGSGGTYGNVLRTLGSNFGIFIYGSAGWTQCSVDEFRVYNTVLTADWITAEFNNQSSPSTFFSAILPNTGGSFNPAATMNNQVI